jgi:hypothetical protein
MTKALTLLTNSGVPGVGENMRIGQNMSPQIRSSQWVRVNMRRVLAEKQEGSRLARLG